MEQIAKIFTGEITDWSEVGGDPGAISCIGRESGSGTRDGFESITGTKDSCKLDQELTSTGGVIEAVAGNPNAIGYASLSAVEGKDTVKAVTAGGVACTESTVLDGSYAIQRPFVLVTKDGTTLSPAAQAFFDFATSKDAASPSFRMRAPCLPPSKNESGGPSPAAADEGASPSSGKENSMKRTAGKKSPHPQSHGTGHPPDLPAVRHRGGGLRAVHQRVSGDLRPAGHPGDRTDQLPLRQGGAPTNATTGPQFGILPFILTSVYGTAGALLLGVPVGLMTAIFSGQKRPRPVWRR